MWKRLRWKVPTAARKGGKEETKEAEAVRTPSTVPLGFDEEEDTVGVPRASSNGSGSEYFDAQELYADNFKLKRERMRLLEELRYVRMWSTRISAPKNSNDDCSPQSPPPPNNDSKKRFREAQLTAQLEEERGALEEKLMSLVEELDGRDQLLARLQAEKADAEQLLQALADYHESTQASGTELQRQPRAKQRGAGTRRLVALAPGMVFLLLLLVIVALLPAVDHRLLGGFGGLLAWPWSAFWRNRASGLAHLGRGTLHQGEYLRSCRQFVAALGGECTDPHVLHMGHDGNLVLFRGASLFGANPVWSTSQLSSYKVGQSTGRASYWATVDKQGVLKVVKVEGDGHKKGPRETVVFSRPVSRLPPVLHGLLVAK